MAEKRYADEINDRYKAAKKINPDLTTGQFMMLSNPDRYQDEQSAARAFRKLQSGEISGQRLHQREKYIRHYKKRKNFRGETEYTPVYEKRRGGYQAGLWKVVLTIEYYDPNSVSPLNPQGMVQEERSYIVHSEFDSNYDIPLIYEGTTDADDDYLSYWADTLYHMQDAQIVGKEVIRIERTSKSQADIHELVLE